ncbi:MAG: hypothetical protein U0175_09440 [Caldilineaceae bacterium]
MSSILVWLALLVALGALGYAWLQSRTIDTINRRLDRYNKALFDAGDEIRTLREQLDATATQLRIEIKKQNGQALFTPDMSVKEAQMVHPNAQRVMASLHLGGCITCAEDSLAKASHDHGVDLNLLLTHLNHLADNEALSLQDLPKAPNVQLEF